MKIFYGILIFFCSLSISAQQTEQYTHYLLNKYQFNPAYAGFDRSLSVNAVYRSQWINVPGNPEQYGLNGHLPIYLLDGALGFDLLSERLGLENNTRFGLSYNYIYESIFGLLSSSIGLGIQSKRINGQQIITPDGEYGNNINHNDPILDNNAASGIAPTWRAGIYLVNDFFEAGIAFENLVSTNFNVFGTEYKNSKHFNAFFQTTIYASEELNLKPSLLVKTNLQAYQTDLGMVAFYRDFLAGINFRGYSSNSIESFGIIIGTKIGRRYTISYSFDNSLNELQSISEGSHEILISYNLQKLIGIGLPPKIIYNPRSL